MTNYPQAVSNRTSIRSIRQPYNKLHQTANFSTKFTDITNFSHLFVDWLACARTGLRVQKPTTVLWQNNRDQRPVSAERAALAQEAFPIVLITIIITYASQRGLNEKALFFLLSTVLTDSVDAVRARASQYCSTDNNNCFSVVVVPPSSRGEKSY